MNVELVEAIFRWTVGITEIIHEKTRLRFTGAEILNLVLMPFGRRI